MADKREKKDEHTIVVSIEKDQIQKMNRYDLIFRSLNLAFKELGYSRLKLQYLGDENDEMKFEVKG